MIRKHEESLNSMAEKAMKSAIRKLRAARKRSGQPLIIWKDGKVVKMAVK